LWIEECGDEDAADYGASLESHLLAADGVVVAQRTNRTEQVKFIRMTFYWTQGSLAEGLRRYNAAQFFAAHEDWESVWLHAPQPEKKFLQALIQVTVALHHMQRGNHLGAKRLLTAALHKLEAYPDDYGNIAVDTLRNDIANCLQLLATNPTATHLPSPRIHPLSH
jgi:uncharacterized protein